MRAVRLWSVLSVCGLLSAQALAQAPLPPTIVSPPAIPLPPAPPPPAPVPDVPQPGGDQPFIGQEGIDPATSVILDNADTAVYGEDDNAIHLRGNVRVRYKGYRLTSDRADIDFDDADNVNTVQFSGNVLITTPEGETVHGGPKGTLVLDVQNNAFHSVGGQTTVPPEELGLGIVLPVYIYGGTISGRPGFIDARDSQFTTCDFDDPHYSFGAKQLYLVPGRHLVAKYVSYYRHGHRLFTIPYLYVPLDRRVQRPTLFPQIGYTPETGYFIKTSIGYALTSTLPGLLNLNYYQKKGLETGFEQAYGDLSKPREGSGVVSFDQLHDNSTGIQNFTYSLNHQQLIGTVQATLAAQGQDNSYFVGTGHSQAQNVQLNLNRNVGAFTTSIQTNLTKNDYGNGLSQTLTSTLDNIYHPDSRTRLETKFDYSDITAPSFGTGGSSDQQRLDSNFDFSQQEKVFDVEILANKFSTLSGDTSIGYGGLERLPEFRLATDETRFSLLRDLHLPTQTKLNLSIGDFNEPSSLTNTERAFFGLDLGDTAKTAGRSTFDYGGVFQQAFYGDDTAQYTLSSHEGYRLRIGGKSDLDATYTYLRPYGFTPFQFDFVGNTNNAALSLNYQETRQFQLTMATAFDFTQTGSQFGQPPMPWQNLAAQLQFTPSSVFQLRSSASYDINHGKLLDLTSFGQLRVHGGQSLDVATRYDPVSHRFSQTNYQLDLPFLRDRNPKEDSGYRLQAIGGYNAITDQFTYEGFALTRSWHDFEATLTYQNDTTSSLQSGQTLTFNFQLKAFPSFQPFNVGQFGQSFSPGLNTVY